MTSGSSDHGDRVYQEDAWLVARRAGAVLCAVCDGMGASTSGRPAADPAVAVFLASFDAGRAVDAVLHAISDANREILDRSAAAQHRESGSDIRWHGMGTTADVGMFVNGRAHLAHVGHGRIYRLGAGALELLTTEHTLL